MLRGARDGGGDKVMAGGGFARFRRRGFSRRVLGPALLVLALGAGAESASAAVTFDGSPGTGPPPPTLGPYTMTPFPPDPNPVVFGQSTTTAPGPTGDVTFNQAVQHAQVPTTWGSWSHGYTGDVYHTVFSADPKAVTMTLPPGTAAFYFYAEPDSGLHNITATSSDGTTSGPISVSSNAGAKYFGFFATGSDTLSSIAVAGPSNASGFAVGEFGIAQKTGPPCRGVPSTIFGGGGAQTLNGTPGPDVIQAGSGGDTVNGGGGDDLLCGGSGGDKVNGDGGNDRLLGESGGDDLNGGPHSSGDVCDGGTGRDTAVQCEAITAIP